MTHLGEGQLHAYLDETERGGAGRGETERHLAECAACRRRLEQERRVRDQARAILSAAGPASLTSPPFDAVVQRAARNRQARRAVRPTVALAWAASLALAVTAGWYARGALMRARGAGEAAVAAGAEPTPSEVRARAIQAAPPAAAQLAQGAPQRVEPLQAPRGIAGTATPTPALPPAPTTQAAPAPIANLAAAEAKAERDTEPSPPPAAQARRKVAAPTPPAAAIRAPVARDVVEPAAGEQTWLTVSPAEAERRLGGPLALIPELRSLGTSVYGTGPSAIAHTTQVLGPGLTIELVQQRPVGADVERAARARAAVAPAPTPEAAGRAAAVRGPGRSLTVQWEGFSVTGRALVPDDSLRKLLASLRRP